MLNVKITETPHPNLSTQEEHLVSAMQALGDKTRFKMFKILLSNQQMCVSEIANTLDVSVPAVSQHFRIFELIGLVDKQRHGQRICYALKDENALVRELIRII